MKAPLLIWAGISNFKLRIVFWNNFFGNLVDLKNEPHFLKKSTFTCVVFVVIHEIKKKKVFSNIINHNKNKKWFINRKTSKEIPTPMQYSIGPVLVLHG